jgi:hypothetical protein
VEAISAWLTGEVAQYESARDTQTVRSLQWFIKGLALNQEEDEAHTHRSSYHAPAAAADDDDGDLAADGDQKPRSRWGETMSRAGRKLRATTRLQALSRQQRQSVAEGVAAGDAQQDARDARLDDEDERGFVTITKRSSGAKLGLVPRLKLDQVKVPSPRKR